METMEAVEIEGVCPCCHKKTTFRQCTFIENLSSLGSFVGDLVLGGAKSRHAAHESLSDRREFPNFKCNACDADVMECSLCREIIPYQHTGEDHECQ